MTREQMQKALENEKVKVVGLPEGKDKAIKVMKDLVAATEKKKQGKDEFIFETHTVADDPNARDPKVIGLRVGGELVPTKDVPKTLGGAFKGSKGNLTVGACWQTDRGIKSIAKEKGKGVAGSKGTSHPNMPGFNERNPLFAGVRNPRKHVIVDTEGVYSQQDFRH